MPPRSGVIQAALAFERVERHVKAQGPSGGRLEPAENSITKCLDQGDQGSARDEGARGGGGRRQGRGGEGTARWREIDAALPSFSSTSAPPPLPLRRLHNLRRLAGAVAVFGGCRKRRDFIHRRNCLHAFWTECSPL